MLDLLGHNVCTVKRLAGGLTFSLHYAPLLRKVRGAPVNTAICLGNLKEGNLGNKTTVGRWREG